MNIQNPFEEIVNRLQRIEDSLAALNHKEHFDAAPEEEPPINISEVAIITDSAIPTVYGWVHRRKIPSYRQGKRLYFLKSEILAWIKAGRRATIQEMLNDDGKST